MKWMVAIAMALGGLPDIHRLWFQPRAILIISILRLQSKADCNEMEDGYSGSFKLFVRYSSPLVSTKGDIGKLLIRMQSA